MGMHNYRELRIWQRSMDLVVKVYKISANFPKEERYSLTDQIVRSSRSISVNMLKVGGKGFTKMNLRNI